MLTIGDCREWATTLAPGSVQTIVTSPPYFGLRSYLASDHPDKASEMGSEQTPDEFVANLVALFAALRPALRDDGTLWVNLGDSYATNGVSGPQGATGERASRTFTAAALPAKVPQGCKPKDLIGIPWLVAFALRADGWYLRSDIVWAKKNCMPESVRDRPTRSHEYIFLLSKSPTYYYDADAIREPLAESSEARYAYGFGGAKNTQLHEEHHLAVVGDREPHPGGRNKRDVWTVATQPYPDAHFATFPPALIRPCILAGSRRGDVVCDPFMGSGTVAQVAVEESRAWVGCDLDQRAREWTRARLDGRQVRLDLAVGAG